MKNYQATYFTRTNGAHLIIKDIKAKSSKEAYYAATHFDDDWGCASHKTFVSLCEAD